MNITILVRSSLKALRKHKVRSFLTVLGIMIGIAAIIVTFSVGSGAEVKIRKQIMAMGENAVYIVPGSVMERGTVRSGTARLVRLKEKDLYAITQQCPEVEKISRGQESLQNIEYGPKGVKDRIVGSDANLLEISKKKTIKGNFFTQYHVKQRSNVVVLGMDIATKLFKKEDPIGKTILIKKIPFTVIGVMEYIDFFWGISDPNNRVHIPFTVAQKYFRKPEEGQYDVGFIGLSIRPGFNASLTLRKVRRILRFSHKIDDGEPDDFTIFDQQSVSSSATAASRVIKLFGLIAASISLLVGGIGVMNIMLVSVQERTKEIGIRLALGATQTAVQSQFLIEAVFLSCVGGILGIAFGILAQHFLSNATDLPGTIEIIPLLVSLFLTIFTGIFFGYYPARKASLLNPVDALRHE
ncbi:ABC transporter permease [Candidatus Dependentiae bacterium]|nr:ABC transporter permease [Candidatus Dependentiae bacterium]